MLNRLLDVYFQSPVLSNPDKYIEKINKSLEVIAPELLPILEQMEKEIENEMKIRKERVYEFLENYCNCNECNPDE
jgi:hypothetical protein